MDIQKQHEDFCKVFKPEFGTIFNIDSVQFEPLEDKYYQDAQRLNWAFAGWLQAAKAQAVPEGFVLVSKDTLNKALNPNDYDEAVCSANELLAVIEAQQPSSTSGCPDEP